ncbi:MAG: hypothetical protein JW952_05485, partial [Candidatus Eisenbacteria bacterium]|nr:hypothetical protein [Candidatus Eisenbacteria bacterium]
MMDSRNNRKRYFSIVMGLAAAALVAAAATTVAAVSAAPPASPGEAVSAPALLSDPLAWPARTLKAVGAVTQTVDGSFAPGDILSFYVSDSDGMRSFRVGMVSMKDARSGKETFVARGVRTFVLIDNAPGG